MKNVVVLVFFKRATVLESHQNEKHSGKYFFGLTMIFPFLSLMFSVIRLFFKNHFHQVIPTFAFFVIIGGKGCTVAPSDDLFLCNDILLAKSLRLFHFTIFFPFSGVMEVHTCPECGKTFGRKSNLKAHRESLHYGKKFPCCHCDRIFTNRSSMNQHIKKTHLGTETALNLLAAGGGTIASISAAASAAASANLVGN